jgi:hypothetical protein
MALELSNDPNDPGFVGPTPPPEEMEKRKSGWRRILEQWQDPNVRSAVMQTGLGLMQSPSFGQSGFDVAANALNRGVTTLQGLRERDRLLAEEKAERDRKIIQQGAENVRADRQVATGERGAATSERNAATQERSVTAQIEQGVASGSRGDRALSETIRHNQASEAIDATRAAADATRANAYSTGRAGKTAAEIEKLNRLQKYYMQTEGLDEVAADKKAFDYFATSKGKSPRQLVIDSFHKKAQMWYENQFDPDAKPTPELREQWKREAIEEVRTAEEAGQDVTNTRGVINRPTPGAPAAPAAPAEPVVSTTPNPATDRSIAKWKAAGASPDQIKILIAQGGEDPKIYGY